MKKYSELSEENQKRCADAIMPQVDRMWQECCSLPKDKKPDCATCMATGICGTYHEWVGTPKKASSVERGIDMCEHDWKKGPVVLYSPDVFVAMQVEVCKACKAISLVDGDGERHMMDERDQTDIVFRVEDGISLAQVAEKALSDG